MQKVPKNAGRTTLTADQIKAIFLKIYKPL
jgi:hypothetical protein